MSATTAKPPSGVVAGVADPLCTLAERHVVAGFLSGYNGLTHDA